MANTLKWTGRAFAAAAGAYAGYVAVTWLRYGRTSPASRHDADPLLDQFIPIYDVVERHHIHVSAALRSRLQRRVTRI